MNARNAAAALLFLAAVPVAFAQVREVDPTWTAPPEAAVRPNPLGGRPETAAGGRKLFEQRCANCHGDDRRGTDKGPDLTSAEVQRQSDGALFWKITQGNTKGGMPTFSFLPQIERWQLVLHLRADVQAR